ncbi:RHS repeat-associated core domain-containing protein [uncultured Allomuricauda sp.]|uniref:RHS repeat-associated core domain-containing protein n=1 Tax=Flagellimonas sp. 389 TaxID=2835862 RepID=UPI0028BE72DE|nr:RHS repeat-associated core domain-containing protein [uncultured Allomuricauda sp.]
MPMPGKSLLGAEGYRYAFQGQEKDPETGKEAFQLRLWDSRIGRWLTTDPYGQYASPYLGMGNNPILMVDADGGFADGCCDDDWVTTGPNQLDGVTMTGTDMSGDMMRGLAGMDFSFSAPLLMSTMIPASAYDYSQETIPGKFEQDWNFVLNGAGGNALTRFGDIFSRDWDANSPEQRREFGLDVTTSIIPGGFIIRGTKTLGKPASKLANKLIKYGGNGKVPLPKLNPSQFKTVSGEIVHIKSGAIYRKSYTTHTGLHGEWKIFTKNSPGFGTQAKKQGHRITTDLEGKIINN